MTQNNGWSYGGNDGVTDATRPLQNVNGQASYQPANQQQGQNAYPQAYASPGYTSQPSLAAALARASEAASQHRTTAPPALPRAAPSAPISATPPPWQA